MSEDLNRTDEDQREWELWLSSEAERDMLRLILADLRQQVEYLNKRISFYLKIKN